MIGVDAAFVVSLARRADRLGAFRERLPRDWPLPTVETFYAIDGSALERPAWWRTTPGAWGCLLSHRAIVDWCLDKRIHEVAIFEDDAAFAPDFAARLAALEVPADCQQLYLGGQHLARPVPGPDGLVVGRNVNRTHAYALFGREALELVRDHLRTDLEPWPGKHHIDHRLGMLHAERRIRCYAVQPWLCGQAGGTSDVGRGEQIERWWR